MSRVHVLKMKRQTFALVALAAASSAAFRVARAPAVEAGRAGHLNVEGNTSLSIRARRGPGLLRVEIEIAEG